MDLNALIQAIQSSASEISESYCIVNGVFMNLAELQNMGYDEFSLRSKVNMPLKLFKYFPNKTVQIKNAATGETQSANYSIQALRNNTVYMQSPSFFDDVYDSDIHLNYADYEKFRLLDYCERCELNVTPTMLTQDLGDALLHHIGKCFNTTGKFDDVFRKKPVSEAEELSNKLFLLRLQNELSKDGTWSTAIPRVIIAEYKDYSNRLQNTFRATCFTTTPYSQLMWGGAYADCHRGFCLEYTVLPNDPQYESVFLNLFPMVYCKTRPNMTEKLVKLQDKEILHKDLWNIYFHGALRKSIDWAYQNEWRLLLPLRRNGTAADYNVPFFPITKVYLGNRMSQESRKEIIEICHAKNIPYVGVTRNPNIFEMQECPVQCENCPNYVPKANQ